IITKIIYTVQSEMFIDTVGMLVYEPQAKVWQTVFLGDQTQGMRQRLPDASIAHDDPLLLWLTREKQLITIYDIAEDARYAEVKEPCEQRFAAMAASLAIPLIYQGEVTGVLALGQKKSGHFYTREDIDLLTTLASQGAIAIANARLFEENLEKSRMEEELKIAHDIQ